MSQITQFLSHNPALLKCVIDKLSLLEPVENELPTYIIVHNVRDSSVVWMSSPALKNLGVTLEKVVEMEASDYYSYYFNPEDAKDYVPKVFGLIERNNDEEFVSFFQQVRRRPGEDWEWYLSVTKIFVRDEEGKPLLTITNATPVDPQHNIAAKAQRLLEENNFLRRNHKLFERLGRREKEILRLMAMGLSTGEIAAKLHIAEATASTHRKNIKNKLEAKTNYDITRFAQAFDLI